MIKLLNHEVRRTRRKYYLIIFSYYLESHNKNLLRALVCLKSKDLDKYFTCLCFKKPTISGMSGGLCPGPRARHEVSSDYQIKVG